MKPVIFAFVRWALASGIVLAIAGCGGGTSTGSTIRGQVFNAVDEISMISVKDNVASISIFDVDHVCEQSRATHTPGAAGHALVIGLMQFDGTGSLQPPGKPGRYQVILPDQPGTGKPEGQRAVAGFFTFDATGNETSKSVGAVSGTVTVDRLDAGGAAGSMDLVMESGDHFALGFHAHDCSSLLGTN